MSGKPYDQENQNINFIWNEGFLANNIDNRFVWGVKSGKSSFRTNDFVNDLSFTNDFPVLLYLLLKLLQAFYFIIFGLSCLENHLAI